MLSCCLFLFSLPLLSFSQEKISTVTAVKKILHKRDIYLFCKGTRAKLPVIAKEFNWADTNITHLGIGVFEKKELVIYNVVNSTRSNALVKDSFLSFVKGDDVIYCSIWKVKKYKSELKKLQRYLQKVQQMNIQFDFIFDLNNGDSVLYCSEFCRQAFQNVNPLKYFFYPRSIKLENALYEEILKRKILNYYPVDFFENNPLFKKIYEEYFSQNNSK